MASRGSAFDDYGRKFVCTANSAVQFLMYEDRYASRNPFYAPPRPLVDVALEQGETVDRQIVHRISPEDPWRRVRNRWRAEGVFAGPPPQPPTYLIGSSGVTLYRGNAFPAEYRQDVFIGIAGNNLVHHRRLTPDGVGFRARRLPDESTEEFLASTDLWFRPVAFANGPDGALYIADLYREILDFSDGIPESIKRFKDLNRGNDRGRIYRVVPDGFKQPALPKLGRASTAELVATLQHANAWHRETAARLIYERQDKAAIPALAELAAQSPSALGRLHALYALDGLDALAESYVLHALADPDPAVREHGVRLSERIIAARGLSDTLWQQLKARAADTDPRVRYQLAFTLGDVRREEATDVLLDLIKKDVELPWMHVAALSSLADGAGEVFTRLRDTPGFGRAAPDQAFLKELIRVIGHRNKGRELLAVLNFVDQISDPSVAFAYVTAFADGLQRADVPLALFQAKLQPVFDRAMSEVRNTKAPESLRIQAIDLLGVTASTGDTLSLLFSLVGTEQPRALQSAAIAALGRLDDPGVARQFLARWPGFTPLLKREVMPVLLARPDRAQAIVEAVKAGTVLRNELTPTQIAGLRAHRSPAVRTLAAAVFEAPAVGRSPGRDRALPARARSPRQRGPRCDDVQGEVRDVSSAGSGRVCRGSGCGGPQGVREGRGPHAPARSKPHRGRALSPLSDRRERRHEPDRHHSARVGEQRHGPAAVWRGADAAAVTDRAAAGTRAVDDAGWPRGRAVAAGHGGPAAVHRRHACSGSLSTGHYQGALTK